MKDYIEFLKDKMAISHQTGFEVRPEEISPYLYPHVKDTVRWAISGGCRAIFSSFGMQKTVTQLEILRVILNRTGGKGLIVCPKRVVVEFLTQAEKHLGMKVTYVRTMQEVKQCPTNIRLSGNFWLVSFKISYLCLPLFYETRTTPSCHPSGCAYRQL